MYRGVIRLLSLGVCALACSGCGGYLSEGTAEFKKGHYAEAKETFLRGEPESRSLGDRERAEYDLYRGLTHGALGDRREAVIWLQEAKAIEESHPGTLSPEDVTRLNLGLTSTDPGQFPGAP